MATLYLSNGVAVSIKLLSNTDARIASVLGSDREMTDAEWSEYCRICNGISLVHTYTAGRFDLWALSGDSKASCRAHVLSVLQGANVPKSRASLTVLTQALHGLGRITGSYPAERNTNFLLWIKSL